MLKLETKYNREENKIVELGLFQTNIWNKPWVVTITIPKTDSYLMSYSYFSTASESVARKFFKATVKSLKATETL